MIIDKAGRGLRIQLEQSYKDLKHAKTAEEKVAISNYIGNLYMAIACMGNTNIKVDKKRCFGSQKNYNKFIKRINIYDDQLINNFVLHKEFHHQYMGEILPQVEEELIEVGPMTFEKEKISKEEILEIIREFTRSIKQEELFNELYKSKKLHSTIIGDTEDNLGFTLCNPVDKDIDVFIRGFDDDFVSLLTLAHELGHGYDLKHFNEGMDSYNEYFYVSFYGEVISRLFERLLYRYLINNNIKENLAKDKLIDTEETNHDYLLEAYLLSVLDDDFLKSGAYINCSQKKLINKVKKHFLDESSLKEFLDRIERIDLPSAYTYAYGDIISMFLCKEVEKDGFDSDLIDYFMSKRKEKFNPEFFEECGFGPDNYTELYKKEIELIKKK